MDGVGGVGGGYDSYDYGSNEVTDTSASSEVQETTGAGEETPTAGTGGETTQAVGDPNEPKPAVEELKAEGDATRATLNARLDNPIEGAQADGTPDETATGRTTPDVTAKAADETQAAAKSRTLLDKITHPGTENPPDAQGLKFSESKGASELAYKKEGAKTGDVYEFPDGKKWQVADVKDDPKTGFRAVALKSLDPNDKRVIVAFSGTDESKDWTKANIPNQFGIPTKQYSDAVEFAKKWQATDGSNVRLTGHSLGGGLASFASIKTGIPATGINSASLAINRQGNIFTPKNNITQYYVPGEVLSTRIGTIGFSPSRPGNGIPVAGAGSILNPRNVVNNHYLENVAPKIPMPKKVN